MFSKGMKWLGCSEFWVLFDGGKMGGNVVLQYAYVKHIWALQIFAAPTQDLAKTDRCILSSRQV
jgi:hypothetical protein